MLGLQKTRPDGLVSLLIPYEWAFIPSAKPIRDYIFEKGWSAFVYRFNYVVFEDVLTTASISIIDKSCTNSSWKYFDINENKEIKEVDAFTDNGQPALDYENRGIVWAMRGLSPGSKRVFTLTENERKKLNLSRRDVRPCVTSFKMIPKSLKTLNRDAFEKYFISKNKKCWLIRTDIKLTESLKQFVKNVPFEYRNSWTCKNQKPWYKYKPHPVPKLLMSSAFKQSGPRILLNEIKAIAVGSVIGIHTDTEVDMKYLHNKLLSFDFNSRIILREQGLKKIAIKQVNTGLNHLLKNNYGKQRQ